MGSYWRRPWVVLLVCALWLGGAQQALAQARLGSFDQRVLEWAAACRDEVIAQMEGLVASGKLTSAQLFDTFYIPIKGTYPQKFHTQYDRHFDEVMREILDRYLRKSDRLLFVVLVDHNGYLPTHNSKYSIPLTGEPEADIKNNRTKRMFNDRTGRTAAANRAPYLLQRYDRDTGETLFDLSVPVFFDGRHWGAIRIGYK